MSARWWWVGYTDTARPKGKRARGAVVIRHAGPEHIIAAELIRRGLAPTGAVPLFGLIDETWGDPPGLEGADVYKSKLLDMSEAEVLAMAWDPGHGGLAGPDDIKAAFMDDAAPDGDPLFKRGPR